MIHKEYKRRQQRFCQAIGRDGIAILAAAKALPQSAYDPFRQASDFYYLTGFTEPNAIAVFVPGNKEGEYILFSQKCDATKTRWYGEQAGQKNACEQYGADQAFPISEAELMLPDLILGKKRLYFDIGRDREFDNDVIHWLKTARGKSRSSINVPDDIFQIGKIIHEMRLQKSTFEIALMRKSIAIAMAAHLRAMRACRAGKFEYQVAAELYAEYIGNNSMPAFPPIVASGGNACTLHYEKNNAKLKADDLILIDAGADYEHYTSDITRTIPIGKKFSKEHRAIYQAVLDTQNAIIAKVRPGLPWNVLQETSELEISKKLLALGILKGNLKKILAEKTFKKFYMHRIGHWLGLDTHDVGKYASDDRWRRLEPGMIFTIEPGIYVPAHTPGVNKKWWNIGVRIEDDILVTKRGCEVLTSKLPKTIAEIEKFIV